MKQTKFKVWDKHYKGWESRACAITNTGKLIIYNPDSGEWFEPQHTGYETVWFTGLKDKNGKDIYEGDIIQDVYDHNFEKWAVMWWPEMAQFVFGNGSLDIEKAAKEDFIMKKDDRIIGNLYENPELLNKK